MTKYFEKNVKKIVDFKKIVCYIRNTLRIKCNDDL